MKAADELAKPVGVKPACAALEVSRSTLYRRRGPSTGQQQPRPTPARALSETERGEVFDTLCSERFVDRSPAEVVATLLDEEVYLCSERTMYRVLASEVPVQERRAQRTHPEYKKPEFEPGVVLGYHAAARAEEVELLLPLRHHGHLQPLRRGLDGGGPGELGPGRPVDPAELPEAWRPAPGPDPALGSRHTFLIVLPFARATSALRSRLMICAGLSRLRQEIWCGHCALPFRVLTPSRF